MEGKEVCSNCILPADFPGADFEGGKCKLCRDYVKGQGPYGQEDMKERCESYFEEARATGADPNVIIGISGGKDSAWLANHLIEKYGMSPALASIDTGFLSPLAHSNIPFTVDALEKRHGRKIEHIFIRDPGLQETYRKVYCYLFKNPGEEGYVHTICYICAPLMEDITMDIATRRGIPLVAMGYSPHQPDVEKLLFEMPEEEINSSHVPPWMTKKNEFGPEDMEWFWDPKKYEKGTKFPRVFAPLHALPYDQEKVKRGCVEKGLIPTMEDTDPRDTNCLLNRLMIYFDVMGKRGIGFNPYIEQFAWEVREGTASKKYWLDVFSEMDFALKMGKFKDKEMVKVSKKIGIDIKKLKEGV